MGESGELLDEVLLRVGQGQLSLEWRGFSTRCSGTTKGQIYEQPAWV